MLPSRHKNTQDDTGLLGGRIGVLPAFVAANGVMVALLVFFGLQFLTADARDADARNMASLYIRAAEQSARDTEEAANLLGYFLAAVDARAPAAESLGKALTSERHFTSFVWATGGGLWHAEKLVLNEKLDKPAAGWPAGADLLRLAARADYNRVTYIYDVPWPALAEKRGDAVPLGLLIKLRLASGDTGVLMAVTTSSRLFGGHWPARRDNLRRIVIQDALHAETLLDSIFEDLPSRGFYRVDDAISANGRSWDMRVDVYPGLVAQFLDAAPWAALFLVLVSTAIAVAILEKKHRQEKLLHGLSQNLKDTQGELQSRISERDRLFHALRKSERENRAVINAVSDVIFETDQGGRIVFLNESWRRITQHEISDTLEKSLFDMIEVQDQQRQRDMFDEFVRGERQAYRTETRLSLGGGTLKPVEIAFSMVRMAEDKSIRIVGTITDIEKRRRAEMAVRDAEQRFRAIFENSISGIYQTSVEGRFISANPALAEILGYDSAEDLMTSVTNISEQLYVRPEDRKAFVQKLLFEGRVTGIEAEMRRKDGRVIWVMENARVVRSDKGGVAYYEGSIWDVTERREAEEAMRQARIQAEISSRSRMEFLANMSHELRTPLNHIIGFSEIIKDEVMGEIGVPVYKEYAQDIYNSGNNLLKIIGEILEVSKIATGNRELNIGSVKLAKTLKSCLLIMGARIEAAGVKVDINLPDDLPDLLAEELGFKQVMLNLIGNAVKFTPAGGQVDVTAAVNERGEMVIDVTDNGIGMSEEEIKKAMIAFGKVDTSFSGMKEGTGLGLTIVESLVKLHGGEFRLISQKGVGTTARVIMPPFRIISNV